MICIVKSPLPVILFPVEEMEFLPIVLFSFHILFVRSRAIPGCLGNLGNFKNTFSDPIEQGQRHSATKRVLATGRKTARALVKKISCSFLRRTKALIREQLPKKDDRVKLLTSKQTSLETHRFTISMTTDHHRTIQMDFYDV